MASATIRDVAKQAGVGVGTVSRVINDSPSVREATRQKVLAAIEDLNYSPNLAARRLSLGKTMTIGVVVPFVTNPSVVKRLKGVVSILADSEYDMILFDVETPARRDACLHEVPRRERVDGLLIVSLTPTDSDAERFAAARVPTVLIDAHHRQLSRVVVNNVAGGYQAVQHLVELGHRRIGYISDYLEDPFNTPVRDRYEGYRQALAEAEIPFRPEYHRQGPHGRLNACQMAHELLALPNPPTAIFAYCDTQAIGVLKAAEERGLSIPGDLSVVGYDNIEVAEYLHLTTVDQSLFESGVDGGELLLEAIDSIPATPQQVMLPTELVIRGSTGPPT
jgi:DNA-binding LacI/PurR family transcriptional regulator